MVAAAEQIGGPGALRLRSRTRRRALDWTVKALSAACALGGIIFLVWILLVVIARGASGIDWVFFTQLPVPAGQTGGGLANAIMGTLYMTGLAVLLGVPTGLLAGVYLSEYGRGRPFADAVRFFINMMMGVPSIIMGLFVYAVLVVPMRQFSGYAGGVALALLILPIVARTTEDLLHLVPNALRESALALGAARWRVTLGVLFPAARAGLLTGVLLAVARISGETAPLLFTALNSPYWVTDLGKPSANLTVTIFNYAMSPYPDWQRLAWGASLLITLAVLLTTVLSRLILKGKSQ